MNLGIKIGKVMFKNPIWVASGTFGSGEEFKDFVNLSKIGAIITKTVTLNPAEGNPPPRIVETASGLLNSIGLENKGIDFFLKEQYPFLKKTKTKVHARLPECMEKEVNVGDIVKIQECRPLSKIIHFVFVEKIKGAEENK